MDINYFSTMLLRGIGEGELSIKDVECIKEDNSLFRIIMSDKSQFLIKVEKAEFSTMELGMIDTDEYKTIQKIFESFIKSQECNERLMRNKFDIKWLQEKLDEKDYYRLEDFILQYSSNNDEIIFAMGFKYAWSLFNECKKLADKVKY